MINFKYAVIYISVIPCVLAKEIKKKNVNIFCKLCPAYEGLQLK